MDFESDLIIPRYFTLFDGFVGLFFHSRRIQTIIITLCVLLLMVKLNTNDNSRELLLKEKPPDRKPVNPCYAHQPKMKIDFDDAKIVNPTFNYIINMEDVCTRRNVEIIMPVKSALTNFNRRNRTRHFRQGIFAQNKRNNAMLLFFVGIPSDKLKNNELFMNKIRNESAVYGDIIQINVTDVYRKVVYKTMAVLQWVSMYCANADFVIKMDDDVLIDPPDMLLSLYRYRTLYSEFIVGELRLNRTPERNKEIKWHMEEEQYPNSTYPPFVMGAVIAYPTSTAELLYQQALRTQTVWLDDIFITGIIAKTLRIPLLNDRYFNAVHRPMKTNNFVYE